MAQLVQTDQGWIIKIPDDIIKIMGVAAGSVGVLYPGEGTLSIEILPPLDPEIKASVLQGCEEMRAAFEEMKRLGD